MTDSYLLDSIEALEAHYGTASPNSLAKEVPVITPHYRALIECSPFVVLTTVGPEGTDSSPRGDAPGFVEILDERTVALPDRPGNNRIDSLRNIVRDPRVSLLFLIPGKGETLRINGQARITTDPDLLERFAVGSKLPRSVLVIDVGTIYFQCQKALARSNLWKPEEWPSVEHLPTAGEMVKAFIGQEFSATEYDAEYPERMKRTIY